MSRRSRAVLLVWVLPLWVLLRVVTMPTSLEAQTDPAATPAAQSTTPEDVRVAVLEAQLDQMRTADERLLQVMQLALGAVLALGIALGTFSWFSSQRSYEQNRQALERDKVAIQTELSAEAARARAALTDDISRALREQGETLSKMQGTLESSLRDMVETRIEAVQTSIQETEAANLKTTQNTIASLKNEQSQVTSLINGSLDTIREMIETMQVDYDAKFLEADARYWEVTEIWVNVVNVNRRRFEMAIRTNNEGRVKHILEKIIEGLEHHPRGLWGDDIVQLNRMLDAIPPGHDFERDRIRELLRELQSKPK